MGCSLGDPKLPAIHPAAVHPVVRHPGAATNRADQVLALRSADRQAGSRMEAAA